MIRCSIALVVGALLSAVCVDAQARYVQSDPIGQKAGPSIYAYVESNPLVHFDPFGLEKNRACVAAYTIGGAACLGVVGYFGGGALGGAGGAAAGGLVCSPSGPGALACAVGGGAGGAVVGSQVGGAGGFLFGAVLGNSIGEEVCPDEESECEALYRTDTDTCNGIARIRGARAAAICHASASQRYAACLRGAPIPPLATWNN
jgi:hypothetical protein